VEKQLEEFGLTKNEISIYLFLLKRGSNTTGPIIKETGVANSRVYESLNSLIKKGLVSYNIQKNSKYFNAEDPKKLLEREEERKKKIELLIPDLLKIKSKESKSTVSAIYEGYEGFKTAFKKIIGDCSVGGTINILGFSEQQHASESLKTFLSNLNLKSVNKKQKLRFILDQGSKEWQRKDREKIKTNEVRYMPKGYISPAAIDIFDDYVYFFVWEEKPYVFMIKNKKVADSFQHYFDFLWGIAKK